MDQIIIVYGSTSFIAKGLTAHTEFHSIGYSLCLSSRDTENNNMQRVRVFLETHREIKSVIWLHFPAVVLKDTSLNSVHCSIQQNIDILKKSMEVFESIRVHKKNFFFLSTDRVGTSDKIFNEDAHATSPVDAYGLSKALCESVLSSRNKMIECEQYKIIRSCSIYGAGQTNNQLIPKILTSCKNKQAIDLGNVKGTRAFLNISDLTDGLIALIKMGTFGQNVYHFTGKVYSLTEVINTCKEMSLAVFDFCSVLTNESNRHQSKQSPTLQSPEFDDLITRKNLNWNPKVSLKQGIKECCIWINNNH